MAASSKKPTHTVRHKRLYLSVDGNLKHIPKGSELALTPKQAKGLGRRVVKIGVPLDLDKLDNSKELIAEARAEGEAAATARAVADTEAAAEAQAEAIAAAVATAVGEAREEGKAEGKAEAEEEAKVKPEADAKTK